MGKRTSTSFKPGDPRRGPGGRKKIPADLKEMYKMGNIKGTTMALEWLQNEKTPIATKVDIWSKFMDHDLGRPAQALTVTGGGPYVIMFNDSDDGI